MNRSRCREIKEENEEYREYSLKLKKFGVVDDKLIPLFVKWEWGWELKRSSTENTVLLLTILKIFVCYTLPIKEDDSCYKEMRIAELRFLDVFIANVPFLFLLSPRTPSLACWS